MSPHHSDQLCQKEAHQTQWKSWKCTIEPQAQRKTQDKNHKTAYWTTPILQEKNRSEQINSLVVKETEWKLWVGTAWLNPRQDIPTIPPIVPHKWARACRGKIAIPATLYNLPRPPPTSSSCPPLKKQMHQNNTWLYIIHTFINHTVWMEKLYKVEV